MMLQLSLPILCSEHYTKFCWRQWLLCQPLDDTEMGKVCLWQSNIAIYTT